MKKLSIDEFIERMKNFDGTIEQITIYNRSSNEFYIYDIDDNRKMNKEEYPEYPYKHPNVPGNYILISNGASEEAIWVHPSTLLNKKYA